MKRNIVRAKIEETYLLANLDEKSFDKAWSLGQINDDIMHEFSEFHFLEVDGNKVGYINFWVIDENVELNRICIIPDERRKGHARFLMDFLLGLCLDNSYGKIILEVAKDNEPAIKLYDNYDFKDVHIRPRYYENGADAIIKVRNTDGI